MCLCARFRLAKRVTRSKSSDRKGGDWGYEENVARRPEVRERDAAIANASAQATLALRLRQARGQPQGGGQARRKPEENAFLFPPLAPVQGELEDGNIT